MKKFRFLEWQVYKDSHELFSFVLKITEKLPQKYKYDLGSQINRSALSIILNIAEGSGKISDAELNRFLDIALGSAYETLAAADTFLRNNIVTKEEFDFIHKKIATICDQLGGFKKNIKKS